MSRLTDDHHRDDPARRATSRSTRSAAGWRSTNCWPNAQALDRFRRASDNLYERVRALFFLYAIHRFHLPLRAGAAGAAAAIPFAGYTHLLKRRFEEAIDLFLAAQAADGPERGDLQRARRGYHALGIPDAGRPGAPQRAPRARQPVDVPHRPPADHPLRIRPELLRAARPALFPILREATPVRMDLTHSGWSDIFFLGMDYPGGRARAERLDRSGRARARTRRPSRRSKPTSASSTSRCCG